MSALPTSGPNPTGFGQNLIDTASGYYLGKETEEAAPVKEAAAPKEAAPAKKAVKKEVKEEEATKEEE